MYAFNTISLPCKVGKSLQLDLELNARRGGYMYAKAGVYGLILQSSHSHHIINFLSWYIWRISADDVKPFRVR